VAAGPRDRASSQLVSGQRPEASLKLKAF